MGAHEQWEEAYVIAERLFNAGRPVKREDLNIFEQIVCSRFNSIFGYDAYKDEYSFIDQKLLFNTPVTPRIRPIAESDLDVLKKNTLVLEQHTPTYINITPIFVVAPFTILVFNNSHKPTSELTEKLTQASNTLSLTPTETEVTPGAEFIFKHKTGKCYRCVILSEIIGDVDDVERKYEVAFLDHCQIVPVKLKTLYIPGELTIEKYPCALQCARLVGISGFRSGFVDHYNEKIRIFYNDKAKRKAGIKAVHYKTNKREQKMIIDYPSIHVSGKDKTETEMTKMQQGHQAITNYDPTPWTYEQLVNLEVRPLEYLEENYDDFYEAKDENKPDSYFETEDDDVDLSESSKESNKKDSQTSSQVTKLPLVVKETDCPVGRSSIDTYLQQVAESSSAKAAAPPKTFGASSSNNNESAFVDEIRDDTGSSLRSASISHALTSSTTTPLPTFEERVHVTPKKIPPPKSNPMKSTPNKGESSDGWGEDTPKKEEKPEEMPQIPETSTAHLKRVSIPFNTEDTVADQNKPSPYTRPPTPGPRTPFGGETAQTPIEPVMGLKISTPENFRGNSLAVESSPEGFGSVNNEINPLPSVSNIILQGNRTSIFGRQIVELDNVQRVPTPLSPILLHSSSESRCVTNDSKQPDSEVQRLINNAQDRFPFTDDEEGWDRTGSAPPPTQQQNGENFGGFGGDDQVPTIDEEFPGVPDVIKQLAELCMNSIRDAAYNKNRRAYLKETLFLEDLAEKLPNDMDKQFIMSQLAGAKLWDEEFY